MRQFHIRALATVGIAALALAACGSSSKSSSGASNTTTVAPTTTEAPSTTVAPTSAAATVKLGTTTKLGKVIVDSQGFTLYRFDNHTVPGKSTCGPGQCASTWPAATVTGTPTAGPGIDATLTTFKRDDGTTQLQISGHPVYRFVGDTKAGDTNGQGILGKWYAVTADGGKAGDNS